MHGGGGRKLPENKGWTLQEKVDETKGKLQLKERDANAFYESSEVKKREFMQMISSMRKENNERRIQLAKCVKGDRMVIEAAFHHRKRQLLSLQNFPQQLAKELTDAKMLEAKKFSLALKDTKQKKMKTLQSLKEELDRLCYVNTTDFNVVKGKQIRRLQNEMDKASIKVLAAKNITTRYRAIRDHIEKDVRNYPAILDSLERQVKQSDSERKELFIMTDKAIHSGEESMHELRAMEREMYQAKRTRDAQVNEMRKEVEKRKEVAEKSEKRTKLSSQESSDSRQARQKEEKEERQEKILSTDDALERIKEATNVSEIGDVIFRLENQDNTFKQLKNMEKEKQSRKNHALDEVSKLKKVFEEIKFTSEKNIKMNRKALDDMADYLHKEEVRHNETIETFVKNNDMLLNIQSGTATLLEKLKDIRLKPPYHNFTKGDPIENLQQCGHKLDMLLADLGMKKNMTSSMHRLDTDRLYEFLESKLPADNMRIRIQTDEMSEDDDFLFDQDTENHEYRSRENIKRNGQDLVNSKLKPKKKKMKKQK